MVPESAGMPFSRRVPIPSIRLGPFREKRSLSERLTTSRWDNVCKPHRLSIERPA